jgi:hypothetical protein
MSTLKSEGCLPKGCEIRREIAPETLEILSAWLETLRRKCCLSGHLTASVPSTEAPRSYRDESHTNRRSSQSRVSVDGRLYSVYRLERRLNTTPSVADRGSVA